MRAMRSLLDALGSGYNPYFSIATATTALSDDAVNLFRQLYRFKAVSCCCNIRIIITTTTRTMSIALKEKRIGIAELNITTTTTTRKEEKKKRRRRKERKKEKKKLINSVHRKRQLSLGRE